MNLLDLAPIRGDTESVSPFALNPKLKEGNPKLNLKVDLNPKLNLKELTPKTIFEDIDETTRIINLPTVGDIDLSICDRLYRPGATIRLRDIQAKAIATAYLNKGLLAPIPVGFGKTLIAYLCAAILDCEYAVILMPPNMVESFKIEIKKYESSFYGPKNWEILPYSMLSSPKSSDLLNKIRPDIIIADEAHCLASKVSSRAGRFRRYMREHPETYFCAMSGSFLRGSILDIADLAFYALRHLSPLPQDDYHREIWSSCLDVNGRPSESQFQFFNKFALSQGIDLNNESDRTGMAREAVYRRMIKTPGIVSSHKSSVDVGLTISKIYIPVPAIIEEAFKVIEDDSETPDHEDIIVDDVQKARITRNLSCGFYYRWAWEVIGGRDEDWLLRRKLWSKELRTELLNRSDVNYDSPLLVTNTIERAIKNGTKHGLVKPYLQWKEVKHKPVPPTVPVWLDYFLIKDLIDRVKTVPTVVWYSSRAMETALAQYMPVYGAGTLPPTKPITCALSIAVHGTGKNLQQWHRAIVVEPPASAQKWEQLLGRHHRAGQEYDVEIYVYAHTQYLELTLEKAIEGAHFVYSLQKTPQKLLDANWR